MTMRLKNWSVRAREPVDPYKPPELQSCHLAGAVYGHPHRKDGDLICTSRVVAAKGRLITTKSGSEYLLDGDPDPEYAKFCKEIGKTLDGEQPIKIVHGPLE